MQQPCKCKVYSKNVSLIVKKELYVYLQMTCNWYFYMCAHLLFQHIGFTAASVAFCHNYSPMTLKVYATLLGLRTFDLSQRPVALLLHYSRYSYSREYERPSGVCDDDDYDRRQSPRRTGRGSASDARRGYRCGCTRRRMSCTHTASRQNGCMCAPLAC